MTTLREAAQQAIALICSARLCEINSMSSRQEMLRLMIEATDTLRAALAEPVQESKILGSTVTEIWNAIEYAHDLGGPLHDRIKKLVEQRQNRAQPVQEPVAWIHTDPDKRRVKFLEWRENEPGYRGDWIKTPLYTAPPQPKERNFCPRCGKQTQDIHTCTPPK